MKSLVKVLAEELLRLSGLARVARQARRGRCLVLAYHGVIPDGERSVGGSSLHVPQRVFAAQLDLLSKRHDVVPLSDLLTVPQSASTRGRVAITFDDAYRGAVTAGVGELARRGLPATIFVAPGFIGGAPFWWDAYPDVPLEVALEELRGENQSVRDWADRHGIAPVAVPHHGVAASEGELRGAVRQGGITLGSHSWSHLNLARLEGARLRDELVRPLQWLRARFTEVVPVLAYPYGFSSPAVEQAAAAAGYDTAFGIAGGWFPKQPPNRYALPRLNVPAGMSLAGFDLRLSGLLCK